MQKQKQDNPARRVLARTLARDLAQTRGGYPAHRVGRFILELGSTVNDNRVDGP
jgi:hypothetical protein